MSKHVWVVEKKMAAVGMGYLPFCVRFNRKDARDVAAYFSGFSKGRNAAYRVRKYTEAGR